jgi:hypothetical protein
MKLRTAAAVLAAAVLSCVTVTTAHASPAVTPACATIPGGTVCEIAVQGYAETELDAHATVSGIVVMWQGTRETSEAAGCTGGSCTFGRGLRLSAAVATCEVFSTSVPGQRTIVYGPVCLKSVR